MKGENQYNLDLRDHNDEHVPLSEQQVIPKKKENLVRFKKSSKSFKMRIASGNKSDFKNCFRY